MSFVGSVARSYVAKIFIMMFYYAAKESKKCHKTYYIYRKKFKIVTFKLNITKYIPLKVDLVIVSIEELIKWKNKREKRR